MNETQFEILKKIETTYTEIARLTAQINIEDNQSSKDLSAREKLLNEVDSLQKKADNSPLGADESQIKEIKQRIKSLILTAMSDSVMLLEEANTLRDTMKEEISKITTTNKAAQGYAAHR
jgi:hypothetical protein